MFPLEIGAVVLGVPTTFQTPLSGQVWPVRAVVPSGALRAVINIFRYLSVRGRQMLAALRIQIYRTVALGKRSVMMVYNQIEQRSRLWQIRHR